MTTQTAQEPADGGDFAALVATFKDGEVALELAEKLREVVSAVIHTGKPGALILTLKITPRKGSDNQVDVVDDVAAKIPEVRAPRIMFQNKDGDLQPDDPRQMAFDIRSPAVEPGEVRRIGGNA